MDWVQQLINMRQNTVPWLPAPQTPAPYAQAAQGFYSGAAPQMPQGDTPIDLHGMQSPIRPKVVPSWAQPAARNFAAQPQPIPQQYVSAAQRFVGSH